MSIETLLEVVKEVPCMKPSPSDEVVPGRDAELHLGELVLRGPIKEVVFQEQKLVFMSFQWLARIEGPKVWSYKGLHHYNFDSGDVTWEGDGLVEFKLVGLGYGVVYPEGLSLHRPFV